MKKAFSISLVAAMVILNACSSKKEEAPAPAVPSPVVKVLDLSQEPQFPITEVGQIKALREVDLVAQAAGHIGQVSARLGKAVQTGEVLAVINFDKGNNPAKVNYETAQLQLSNARQNYSRMVANNQDAITRSRLRLEGLETTLGRLQRNLQELIASNQSTQTTLELQRKNAEQNAKTAEINYDNLIAQFEQSWEDLLQGTETSLTGVYTNVESNFTTLENILNPGQRGFVTVSSLPSAMGATNSIQKSQVVNLYNELREELPRNKSNYLKKIPLTSTNVLPAVKEARASTEALRAFAANVRTMLNNSVTGIHFSETLLASYLSAASTAESRAIGDLATLDGLEKAIANFKLDRTSQLANAENSKMATNNHLAEARNALSQFQITRNASVKDLETQIAQTQNDILSAQADLESAQRSAGISNNASRLEIQTLENQLRLAENTLSHNEITSPIEGVLSELAVDEGDYVSPGTYLGRVIQSDSVKVVFYLSEENAARVRVSEPFSFFLSGNRETLFTGTVSKIAPAADPVNKKIRIEGTINNPDRVLKPEMYVSLQLDLSAETFDPEKIYAPVSAIIFGQNERYVYVLEDSTAVRRPVTIGKIFGMWVEITEGLFPEDQLIIEGQRNLPPAGGIEVRTIN